MKSMEDRVNELEEKIKFLTDRLVDAEGNLCGGTARFSRLEIGDSNDRMRIRMGTQNNNPKIEIFDELGIKRLGIETMGNAPILTMLDVEEKIRVALTILNNVAGFALYDETGKCRVHFSVTGDGQVTTTMDSKGKVLLKK